MQVKFQATLSHGTTSSMLLEVETGNRIRDVLKAAQAEGFQIGYMRLWLNQKPVNDPIAGLGLPVQEGDQVRVEYPQCWELD